MKKLFLLAVIGFSNILTAQITTLISGGQEVDIREVPHQVSLQIFGKNNCGGSIIGNKWVLTAAHCFDEPITHFTIVKAGISKLDTPILTTKEYQILQVIRHPNYNKATLENDIALLELTQNIEFNSNTQPIHLADTNELYNVGRNTKVSGWGLPVPGVNNGSNELRIVEVPIMSNNDAQQYYSSPITNNMIATHSVSNSNRKGTCRGDSGGALTTIDNSGLKKQIGIVSWGSRLCMGGLRSASIYTKVANYIDWIRQYVPITMNIQGKKAVCNTPQTYTANNPNGGVIQWELPDSVEKISETANSITIKAKQSYGSWATLKAINGTTETTKQIWVGKAPLSFELYTIDDERYAVYKLVSNEPALSLEDFGINYNSLTCEYTLVPNFDAVLYSGNCIGGSIQAHPNNTTDPMVGLSIEIKNKPNEECIDVNWAASMIVKNYNIPNNLHLYSVSPNPARDVVHISLSNLATIQNKMKTTTTLVQKLNTPTYGELFDYMGKKVAQVQITNGKAQLNVNGLKGTYILKISTNGYTEQHKIIVK